MTAVEETVRSGPPDPLEVARAQLVPGEKLVWAETSLPRNARRRSLPIAMLGWLFFVLAVFWMSKAVSASIWLIMMGMPFLLGGLALAFIPWWWPQITRHTIYAITDQRLLIIRDWPRRKVTSYGPEDIDVVERRERRDGSGDLVFRREEYRKLRHHHDAQGKRRAGEREIGFFGVPEVRRLEEAVWALKQERDPATPEGDPAAPGGYPAASESDSDKDGQAVPPPLPSSRPPSPSGDRS